MPRGPSNAAGKQLNTTNALGNQYAQQGQNVFGQLYPEIQQYAKNPPGFDPQSLAGMETANLQSLGGATSGITGQANLTAARRRNPAGYATALDTAQKTKGEEASQAALGVQAENARLKQEQQRFGLASLGNLFSQNAGLGQGYYDLGPSTINAWTNASPGWLQNVSSILGDLRQAGGAAAGAAGANA
jgi:hypothetical protein